MDFYSQTHKNWNKYAAHYQERYMDLDIYNHCYEYFCNALAIEKAEVLEVGCGPGNISRFLLNKQPQLNPNYSLEHNNFINPK